MTVGELKEELGKYSDDLDVFINEESMAEIDIRETSIWSQRVVVDK